MLSWQISVSLSASYLFLRKLVRIFMALSNSNFSLLNSWIRLAANQ
jgi:hypothetical protein